MSKYFTIIAIIFCAFSTPTIANDVQNTQQLLTELEYNPGPIDGSYGGKTKRA
ncbi:MAG: peptidoglycan-binding protein [Amylibacter sp.]|nr:peptidoglycan-binding protein [Amylibacter sp.]|tara:strand:+ start:4573 stop:4731 length:159 start_codon:yes stop_codon:yes gene_type:complete